MAPMDTLLDADQTDARLPYGELAIEIRALLADATFQVPGRLVQPLPGGGSLFLMPALDGRIAVTKLITFTPAIYGTPSPAILGDEVEFEIDTGTRMLVI